MRFAIALLLLGMGLASYDIFLDRAASQPAPATGEQAGEITKAEDGTPWPKP
jgi:hypothetical protein